MSDTATGNGHAFSWTATGGMVDLGTLPGGDRSAAMGVSNGQVVGRSFAVNGRREFGGTRMPRCRRAQGKGARFGVTGAIAVCLQLLILTNCHTVPIAVVRDGPASSAALFSVEPGNAVLLLPPDVRYRRVENDEPLSVGEFGTTAYETFLARLASSELSGIGFRVIEPDDLRMPQNEFGNLMQQRQTLANPYRDKTPLIPLLHKLHAASGAEIACLVTLLVKVGHGPGYEPFGGHVWQGTSSSALSVVLISLTTGTQVWRSEVFTRQLPTDDLLRESIELALESIKNGGNVGRLK